MGSLTSTPKTPQRQVPSAPVYAPKPTVKIIKPEAKPTGEDISKDREKTLLARRRGRFGTITTSFKGLLGIRNSDTRKTLLGE